MKIFNIQPLNKIQNSFLFVFGIIIHTMCSHDLTKIKKSNADKNL